MSAVHRANKESHIEYGCVCVQIHVDIIMCKYAHLIQIHYIYIYIKSMITHLWNMVLELLGLTIHSLFCCFFVFIRLMAKISNVFP